MSSLDHLKSQESSPVPLKTLKGTMYILESLSLTGKLKYYGSCREFFFPSALSFSFPFLFRIKSAA